MTALNNLKKRVQAQNDAILYILGHLYHAPQDEVKQHIEALGGEIPEGDDEGESKETVAK